MGDNKTINKASHETWTHTDRINRWTAMAAKSIAVTKIVTVKASNTVQQAFETLSDENVLSAPIFDEDAHKYVGVIDFVDIVSYLAQNFQEDEDGHALASWKEVIKAKNEFFATPVTELADFSHRNPFRSLADTCSLLDVIKEFSTGLKRVFLTGPKGDLTGLITQTTVLRYFSQHNRELGDIVKLKLSELNLGEKHVITIKDSDKAIDAFKVMATKQLSSLLIVDSAGTAVGHISARDLKGIKAQFYQFNKLFDPVLDLVKIVRNADDINAHVPVFTCRKEDNFHDLLNRMALPRLHKIYLTDDQLHPQAVITVKDVIDVALSK